MLETTLTTIIAAGYFPTLHATPDGTWFASVRRPIGQTRYSYGQARADTPTAALDLAFAARSNLDEISDGSVAYADKLRAEDFRPKLNLRRL